MQKDTGGGVLHSQQLSTLLREGHDREVCQRQSLAPLPLQISYSLFVLGQAVCVPML